MRVILILKFLFAHGHVDFDAHHRGLRSSLVADVTAEVQKKSLNKVSIVAILLLFKFKGQTLINSDDPVKKIRIHYMKIHGFKTLIL